MNLFEYFWRHIQREPPVRDKSEGQSFNINDFENDFVSTQWAM